MHTRLPNVAREFKAIISKFPIIWESSNGYTEITINIARGRLPVLETHHSRRRLLIDCRKLPTVPHFILGSARELLSWAFVPTCFNNTTIVTNDFHCKFRCVKLLIYLWWIQGLLYHRTCKRDFLCSWPSLNSYLE